MAKHAIKFEDRAELEKEDDFLTAFLYFPLPPPRWPDRRVNKKSPLPKLPGEEQENGGKRKPKVSGGPFPQPWHAEWREIRPTYGQAGVKFSLGPIYLPFGSSSSCTVFTVFIQNVPTFFCLSESHLDKDVYEKRFPLLPHTSCPGES